MTDKTLRNLFCSIAASATWAFAAPAHAIAYSVGFDPPGDLFTGVITIDVAPGCLVPFPGTNNCAFDVTNVSFTDGAGTQWFDPAVTETGIGQQITLDNLDNIIAILVSIDNLQPLNADNPCDGNTLSFALDNTVTFNCGGNGDHDGVGEVTFITRVAVPEPATYALLGLGVLVLAASRRRRPR